MGGAVPPQIRVSGPGRHPGAVGWGYPSLGCPCGAGTPGTRPGSGAAAPEAPRRGQAVNSAPAACEVTVNSHQHFHYLNKITSGLLSSFAEKQAVIARFAGFSFP